MATPNEAMFDILTKTVKLGYGDGWKNTQTDWEKVATKMPSGSGSQVYPFASMFPQMEKMTAERIFKAVSERGYELPNELWSAAIKLKLQDIEDDQYGVIGKQGEDAGYETKIFPERNLFGPLLDKAASALCYDGTPMIGANHDVGSKKCSKSNLVTGGAGAWWYLMATGRPIKPLIFQERLAPSVQFIGKDPTEEIRVRERSVGWIVETRAAFGYGLWQMIVGSQQPLIDPSSGEPTGAFESAFEMLMGMTDPDRGNKLGLRPTLLVVGPSNRLGAIKNVVVEKLATGKDNPNYKAVDVLINPWIT